MKDKIISFFKSKFNIALIVLQILAIVCYFLSRLGDFFSIIFFVLEGAFFVVWGIKILYQLKVQDVSKEVLNQLPYSDEEKERQRKLRESVAKNNRFIAICFIVLGLILVFSLFSLMF